MPDDPSLWIGLGCDAIPRKPRASSGTLLAISKHILQTSEFGPWNSFDQEVSQTRSQVSRVLRHQGCRQSNEQQGRCTGTYRDIDCNLGCELVVRYKHEVRCIDSLSSNAMQQLRDTTAERLLHGLRDLAMKILPGWQGDINSDLRIDISRHPDRFFVPSIAVTQPSRRRNDRPRPDIIVQVRYPITTKLVLTPEERRSLPEQYNYECSRFSSSPSYALVCIAQTIVYALCTTSGMGCLFNNNEAIFLKVTPRGSAGSSSSHGGIGASSSRRSDSRYIKQAVWLSRKYKCDEIPSSFHGVLTLMLKGYRQSNPTTTRENTEHLYAIIRALNL